MNRRDKTTGKLEVWRAHFADTGETCTVSSVVTKGSKFVGRTGRIRHFISLKKAETIIDLVTVDLFASNLKHDKDSGLCCIETTSKKEEVFSLENISKPIVTAIDEEKPCVLWPLNIGNV